MGVSIGGDQDFHVKASWKHVHHDANCGRRIHRKFQFTQIACGRARNTARNKSTASHYYVGMRVTLMLLLGLSSVGVAAAQETATRTKWASRSVGCSVLSAVVAQRGWILAPESRCRRTMGIASPKDK